MTYNPSSTDNNSCVLSTFSFAKCIQLDGDSLVSVHNLSRILFSTALMKNVLPNNTNYAGIEVR